MSNEQAIRSKPKTEKAHRRMTPNRHTQKERKEHTKDIILVELKLFHFGPGVP